MVQGSLRGMLAALDTIAALGAEAIVPGHGEVCGPEVVDHVRGYVRFVQRVAAAGHAAGVPPLEAASTSPPP